MIEPKMQQQYVTIYWLCDKHDCKKENFRLVLANNPTVYYDHCDHCLTNIHEPITSIIYKSDNENPSKTSH